MSLLTMNDSSLHQEESIQPSSTLIDIIHRKLRDPSIVPSFERHRARHVTAGLVRPRWVLQPIGGDDGDMNIDNKSASRAAGHDVAAIVVNTGEEQKMAGKISSVPKKEKEYNTIPKRNYIDLRMQQNKMFADEQHHNCQQILLKLTASQSKQWKKQADAIQSMINEGLAACPNHEGLLGVEKKYKGWIQQRIHLLSGGQGSLRSAQATANTPSRAVPAAKLDGSNEGTTLPNPFSNSTKKGAEGRAQAAMRDAIMERTFLLGDNTGEGDDGKLGVKYPLLTAEDDFAAELQEGETTRKERHNKEGDETRNEGYPSSDEGSRCHSHRRRKKKRRSKHKYKRRKRSKRRHYRDDNRQSRKDRSSRRSRSESSSSRSRSRSRSVSASSSSDSSYRRRKHYRREKKRRRDKKHHKRRYYSSNDEDDDVIARSIVEGRGRNLEKT